MTNRAAFVEIARVTKTFGSRRVLDQMSLHAAEGESVVIVGPSGCGKTTLLRVLAGLDGADEGEVRIAGRVVTLRGHVVVPPHRRGLGFVFQDLALWPHMTVGESLAFVLRPVDLSRGERESRIRETLAMVHLTGFERRYPHELSGGEQQRAALARALVARPRLLLLDEPLSSLDDELRLALRQELQALRTPEMTMVHVTHNRDDAYALADRIVEMRAGQTVVRDDTGAGAREL